MEHFLSRMKTKWKLMKKREIEKKNSFFVRDERAKNRQKNFQRRKRKMIITRRGAKWGKLDEQKENRAIWNNLKRFLIECFSVWWMSEIK